MNKLIPEITTDPHQAADEAGLVYVSDVQPGIRRRRQGKSFYYCDSEGKVIKNEKILGRIKSLVIPPAWTDVWICANPNGHLQATGRDSKNRKQYRYHPQWRAFRDQTKYDRMLAFGLVLPKLRRHIKKDLALPGLPRTKVLATVVETMEKTLIRVGNEEYSKKNNSFGLTTLRNRHVKIKGTKVLFSFKGKSGVWQNIEMTDPRLQRASRP
jgi:DNA topoisomerase-1